MEYLLVEFYRTYARLAHFLLDNRARPAKNTANSGKTSGQQPLGRNQAGIYDFIQSRPTFRMIADLKQCKHPRVKVVAREEDSEFVECLECGEVFESSEFRDMQIEESKLKEG